MQQSNINELIQFRRQLHQYPELGYQEFKTSKLICKKLDELGVSYQSGLAKTGIVAEIKKGAGKCIALRADMDALPIVEATGLDFSSKNKGVMHACGHDVHTTILMGAITQLINQDFRGKIKFIFQPSEEGVNGDTENKSGGQRIVELGILKDVDYALALHVHPLLEVGKLGYALGNALACTGNFSIQVRGKSGHAGAAPHLAIDGILVATTLIQNLYTIVSRNINPTKTGVVSVTMINGGQATNIIADNVIIKGTIRALDMEEYDLIIQRMNKIIKGVSESFGAAIDWSIDLFYPSLINHSNVHKILKSVGKTVFGEEEVLEVSPMLGGEDFAFYSREVPSMFYFIGAKNTNEPCYFLHHPKVVINEDCIQYGVDFLTKSALKLMLSSD
ncbi:MAG TPA: amidohydrolase [Phaeodactylibacter sp.]|nr:amidohydrolase [Phaeodactylibacter sp.]